jgi:hypothetical protein
MSEINNKGFACLPLIVWVTEASFSSENMFLGPVPPARFEGLAKHLETAVSELAKELQLEDYSVSIVPGLYHVPQLMFKQCQLLTQVLPNLIEHDLRINGSSKSGRVHVLQNENGLFNAPEFSKFEEVDAHPTEYFRDLIKHHAYAVPIYIYGDPKTIQDKFPLRLGKLDNAINSNGNIPEACRAALCELFGIQKILDPYFATGFELSGLPGLLAKDGRVAVLQQSMFTGLPLTSPLLNESGVLIDYDGNQDNTVDLMFASYDVFAGACRADREEELFKNYVQYLEDFHFYLNFFQWIMGSKVTLRAANKSLLDRITADPSPLAIPALRAEWIGCELIQGTYYIEQIRDVPRNSNSAHLYVQSVTFQDSELVEMMASLYYESADGQACHTANFYSMTSDGMPKIIADLAKELVLTGIALEIVHQQGLIIKGKRLVGKETAAGSPRLVNNRVIH